MKKWIVLIMALIFTLGITSMVLAAEEKKPSVPGMGPEEKRQVDDTQKKATIKKKAGTEGPPPGIGAEEKTQIDEAKKKPTVKKKKSTTKKAGDVPGIGAEEKTQIEEAKKKGTVEKSKEMKKEAAPAEKK